ncbi:MAG: hypothetical protein PHY90_09445, partial [Desulfitobacteriaceae bacterium]|nr:hypothetical protein [Desulfitobacteriaceae bacterium]
RNIAVSSIPVSVIKITGFYTSDFWLCEADVSRSLSQKLSAPQAGLELDSFNPIKASWTIFLRTQDENGSGSK